VEELFNALMLASKVIGFVVYVKSCWRWYFTARFYYCWHGHL